MSAPDATEPLDRALAIAREFLASLPDRPVEYESIATRGSTPNCAAVTAEEMAISASCSAVGCTFTAQSP